MYRVHYYGLSTSLSHSSLEEWINKITKKEKLILIGISDPYFFFKDKENVDCREKIAEFCHNQWSNWMVNLFSRGVIDEEGNVIIRDFDVKRWNRQMKTKYKDLSEDEKDNDRREADKFIELFERLKNE